jgi:hypothetical protein
MRLSLLAVSAALFFSGAAGARLCPRSAGGLPALTRVSLSLRSVLDLSCEGWSLLQEFQETLRRFKSGTLSR